MNTLIFLMHGTILIFIKFNNFGTWHLNKPRGLFHSFCCTTQYIFEPLHVYELCFNMDKYNNYFAFAEFVCVCVCVHVCVCACVCERERYTAWSNSHCQFCIASWFVLLNYNFLLSWYMLMYVESILHYYTYTVNTVYYCRSLSVLTAEAHGLYS